MRNTAWLAAHDSVQASRPDYEATALRHCVRRARERYGLKMDASRLRGVINRLKREGAILVRQGWTRHIIEIEIEGKACVVAYDPTKKLIRTFLPARGAMSINDYLEDLKQYFDWE